MSTSERAPRRGRSAVTRVAIVGSTATGKSAVALAAARAVAGTELISIDSMQVYRGMDIGTAKPTRSEQVEIPHHCIDLVDPTDDFTVADFVVAHDRALDEVAGRGGRALLVGGTGLYHRVVVDELDLPGEHSEVRAELERVDDTIELHRRLAALDPVAASKIEPTNRRRVLRALEVTIGTGRPFSSYGPGFGVYPATPVVQIGLRRPREVVRARIEARVREMLDAGLVAEVVGLLDRGGFSRTAGQALGYKEIAAALRGETSEDEAVARIITRTRQFAVRQERWFRRDPRVRWITVEDDAVSEVAPAVVDALTGPTP